MKLKFTIEKIQIGININKQNAIDIRKNSRFGRRRHAKRPCQKRTISAAKARPRLGANFENQRRSEAESDEAAAMARGRILRADDELALIRALSTAGFYGCPALGQWPCCVASLGRFDVNFRNVG